MLGGVFYVVGSGLIDERLLALTSMLIVFVSRLAALYGKLHLPEFIVAGHELESTDASRDR